MLFEVDMEKAQFSPSVLVNSLQFALDSFAEYKGKNINDVSERFLEGIKHIDDNKEFYNYRTLMGELVKVLGRDFVKTDNISNTPIEKRTIRVGKDANPNINLNFNANLAILDINSIDELDKIEKRLKELLHKLTSDKNESKTEEKEITYENLEKSIDDEEFDDELDYMYDGDDELDEIDWMDDDDLYDDDDEFEDYIDGNEYDEDDCDELDDDED